MQKASESHILLIFVFSISSYKDHIMSNTRSSAEERAQARAEALLGRLEAQAEEEDTLEAASIEEERLATTQATQNQQSVVVRASANWDPFGDDPEANHIDGFQHPEEDAINDREANHEIKRDAWLARAERLTRQGKIPAAIKAENHAQWHGWRAEP
jgi:hypothetical protein